MSMDAHALETLREILCHLRGEQVPRYHDIMFGRDSKPIRNQEERDAMRALVNADLKAMEKYRCQPGEPFPHHKLNRLFDEQRMLDDGIFYNPNEDMLL